MKNLNSKVDANDDKSDDDDAHNDDEDNDTLIQACDSLEVFCKQRIASTQRAIERVSLMMMMMRMMRMRMEKEMIRIIIMTLMMVIASLRENPTTTQDFFSLNNDDDG